MGIPGSRRVARLVCAMAWMALSYCTVASAQGIPTSRSAERRLAPDALIEIAPAMQYGLLGQERDSAELMDPGHATARIDHPSQEISSLWA